MWKNFMTRNVAADLGFNEVTGYREDRRSWTSADLAPSQLQ